MEQVFQPPHPHFDDPLWVSKMRSLIGLHELPGPAIEPTLARWFALVGLAGVQDDTTPWCSVAMNGVFHDVGMSGTGKANARSWLKYGVRLKEPIHGCVLIFSRPPDPSHGHVALYDANSLFNTEGYIAALGGNEDNQIKVKPYMRGRLIGCRWPSADTLPEGAVLDYDVPRA